MLSHRSITSEYFSCIVDGKMDTEHIAIHALPLYHSAQLHVFLGPSVDIGPSGIILQPPSPPVLLERLEQQRPTLLFSTPTLWIALLRNPDFYRPCLDI